MVTVDDLIETAMQGKEALEAGDVETAYNALDSIVVYGLNVRDALEKGE